MRHSTIPPVEEIAEQIGDANITFRVRQGEGDMWTFQITFEIEPSHVDEVAWLCAFLSDQVGLLYEDVCGFPPALFRTKVISRGQALLAKALSKKIGHLSEDE